MAAKIRNGTGAGGESNSATALPPEFEENLRLFSEGATALTAASLVSGGEPAGANEILITKAYKIAFEEYRYAYSAAYSTVIFLILLVYGVFQTRMTRATEAVHT